jgi:C4-dicarboxylate-specific signal transduction histidine kinase
MDTLETVQVPPLIIHKWQEIIDLLAEMLNVPSALVIKAEPPHARVLVSSESQGNPYERNGLACLNTGLYCETVMQTRELLLVPNALVDLEWKSGPDCKLGMISYMGLPVAWPNGNIFGTICVLDRKQNEYSELYKKLLFQFREVLQADLKSLQATTELELKVLERTAQLRRSEVYSTEAQRLSRTGSFGWNVDSGELYWSEESFRIFGYDRALSPTFDMILQRVHPDDLPLVRQTIDRASRDGKDIDLEHRLLLPDGSIRNIHVVAHAVRDEAGRLKFHGALMDNTAAKHAEEELRKAQAELAHVTRVTTLGQLTASIAHEVKQPIAAAVAFADAGLRWLAAQPPDLGEARDAFDRIIKAGSQAGEIIARIRGLIKNVPERKAPLDINEAILETIVLTRSEMRQHGILLQTELGNGLPRIWGDRVQLQQVIMNLIMNAIEAMSEVSEGSRQLLIGTSVDTSGRVVVAVRDSGPGLKPESLDRLFDPFFTTKPAGTGMGLSICRSITEAHGGQLWAAANVPQGASFHFSVPVAASAQREDSTSAQ